MLACQATAEQVTLQSTHCDHTCFSDIKQRLRVCRRSILVALFALRCSHRSVDPIYRLNMWRQNILSPHASFSYCYSLGLFHARGCSSSTKNCLSLLYYVPCLHTASRSVYSNGQTVISLSYIGISSRGLPSLNLVRIPSVLLQFQ
jgi:hypothetical protein